MAVEKVIKISADTSNAQKNFDRLSKTIQEQKDITISFQKDLARLEERKRNTSKKDIAQQKALNRQIKNLKVSIKDQALATKDLNNQRSKSKVLIAGNTKGVGMLKGGFKTLKMSVLSMIPALNGFAVALFTSGVGAFAVILGALGALFISSGIKGAEFGKAMSGLRAVLQGTDKEMYALSASAKRLGSTTEFTATQVVGLATELAKLGFNTEQILNMEEATLALASSLGVGLSEAAMLTGSVLNSFGLDSSEAGRVVDILAKSTTKSALDFAGLTESLKLVAPTARALKIPLEQTVAMLGKLADGNLKGSIAGTGLSKTLIELNKSGILLPEAFEKISKSGNKLNTAIDLVKVIGGRALLTLSENSGGLDELTKSLYGAEGAAKALAKAKLDNLAGDTTKLGSAWEGFVLNIEDGEGAINSLARGAVQLLTETIVGLQLAISFTSFIIQDAWESIKNYTSSGADITIGFFNQLGAGIKLFANKAILSIAEIPIIGRVVDKNAIQKNVDDASKAMIEGSKKIEEGVKKYEKQKLREQTTFLRFAEKQKAEALIVSKKQAIKELEEIQKEQSEEDKEAAKEAAAAEEKRLAGINKIRDKFRKKNEDLEDEFLIEKLERQYERDLKELEALAASEEQKLELRRYYNGLIKEEEKNIVEKADEEEEQKEIDEEDQRLEDAEIKFKEEQDLAAARLNAAQSFEDAKYNIANQGVNLLSNLAGKSKAIAKAVLLVEKGLAISQVVTSASRSIAQATANLAATPAALGAIPNPMFKVQAAATAKGIATTKISAGLSIASILGQTIGKLSGGNLGGGGGSDVGTRGSQAPSFNLVQGTDSNQIAQSINGQSNQPVEAYVVSGTMTTAQEADRNKEDTGSI